MGKALFGKNLVIFNNSLYENIGQPSNNHLIAAWKFCSVTPKYGSTSPKDEEIISITSYLHLALWVITKYLPLISLLVSVLTILLGIIGIWFNNAHAAANIILVIK